MRNVTQEGAGTGRSPVIIDVWFDAGVWCADTHVGTVSGLVCSARSPHLYDVVIRDVERPHTAHAIDARDIAGSRGRDLVVSVSPAEARARRIPTKTVMVTDDRTWWAERDMTGTNDWLLYGEPLQVPVAVPRLRPGDVLVHRHPAVYVGDHHVGRLSGIQTDTSTRKISGVIVDVGHHWHHRQVVVPAGDVEELSDLVVSLRGTREGIRHMPGPTEGDLEADPTAVEPHEVGGAARDRDGSHIDVDRLERPGPHVTATPVAQPERWSR